MGRKAGAIIGSNNYHAHVTLRISDTPWYLQLKSLTLQILKPSGATNGITRHNGITNGTLCTKFKTVLEGKTPANANKLKAKQRKKSTNSHILKKLFKNKNMALFKLKHGIR